ncbi:hypothetical protein BEH94_05435 [Candidatus Altiarchaeales archaeon WOR_SM1_SCG]|nr:hypothetical protein BEH94_05435 [Candidatus Altiarchaeales archaeon WOR_SM1_SCG]
MVSIKDNLVKWFIKTIVLPRTHLMDNPGFLISKVSEKGMDLHLRSLWIPEGLFVEIENKIVEKFRSEGRQALYSAGWRFGWRYGIVANFANIHQVAEKQLLKNMYLFIKYVTCIWAREYDYEPDIKNKTFRAKSRDFIVCDKNGIGHLMSEGCPGGYFAYLMDDATLQGTHIKCQGKGNEMCELIFAPAEVLERQGIKYIKETNTENLELGKEYRDINAVRKTEFEKYSFSDLINSGVFKHRENYVMYLDERHFHCEASMIDLLETEIQKLGGGEDLMYDVCFEFGKKLGKKMAQEKYSASTYMSAIGWGDILVMKKSGKTSVYSKYFPWTIYSNKLNFIYFSGIMSGMLSGIENKDIKLKKKDANIEEGYLTVTLEEV